MKYVEISAMEAFEALAEKRMSKKDILCKDKEGKSLTTLDRYRGELDALLHKRLFMLDKEGEKNEQQTPPSGKTKEAGIE